MTYVNSKMTTNLESNPKQEESFKEQLDKKAVKPEPSPPNPVVEKSMSTWLRN